MGYVAPFVGVWIEICSVYKSPKKNRVAPFVGVWIEIIAGQDLAGNVLGRSLRGSVD